MSADGFRGIRLLGLINDLSCPIRSLPGRPVVAAGDPLSKVAQSVVVWSGGEDEYKPG